MKYKHLTTQQQEYANQWLAYIFTITGYAAPTTQQMKKWASYCNSNVKSAAIDIVDEIFSAEFKNIDNAVDRLLDYQTTIDGVRRTKNSATFASYLANFCAENQFYWDDSIRTPYELDEFKKTYLGKALDDFGCFVSQPPEGTAPAKSRSSSSSASTPRSSGSGPLNNYKSTGPQSGNVRGLIGEPFKKIQFAGYVFGIEGDNTKAQKVGAFAHIKPLSAVGKATDGDNRVFLGSSNGYTDCKVYLEYMADADAFLQKCLAVAPDNIQNLHVTKKHADPNGYYRVNTQFGPVLIAAQKLNEQLTETLEDESIVEKNMQDYFQDIDEFDKNLRKYN